MRGYQPTLFLFLFLFFLLFVKRQPTPQDLNRTAWSPNKTPQPIRIICFSIFADLFFLSLFPYSDYVYGMISHAA